MRKQGNSGWIGVDLDGTLAYYDRWTAWNAFGAPLMPMVERIRRWLDEGIEVRILTARYNPHMTQRCHVTNTDFSYAMMAEAIQDYCEKHVREGWRPTVTNAKDMAMIELWDDRCVQVVPNTGRSLAEEHEAERLAREGKP